MPDDKDNYQFWIGLARAFAGATIFALPMLMTMEMWWLGFYMDQARLGLFIVVNVVLLIGLERYRGFKHNIGWLDTTVDAFVGYMVGFATCAVFLPLFGIVKPGMGPDEIIGKIALQAVPASIGALLARSQLGGQQDEPQEIETGYTFKYLHEIFIMLIGAIFVSLNVAPTEEMVLVAYKITPGISLLLVLLSLAIIHAFVYGVEFRGERMAPEQAGFFRLFFGFTLAGYAVVLVTSLYILWTFGRLDGNSLEAVTLTVVVLGVPGAIGAAAARLTI